MGSNTLTRPLSHRTDEQTLASLRAGDEESFAVLVGECQPLLMRLAESFTPNRAAAEAVVHDAWLGVIRGLDGFAGHSTLRAWILRTLVDGATSRAAAERGGLPFASLDGNAAPAVDADRFLPAGRTSFAGHWAQAPAPWEGERLSGDDVSELLREAIDALPPGPRAVVSLRDVNGWSSEEVCDALGLSGADQRTLLHRGRSALRTTLEAHFGAAA